MFNNPGKGGGNVLEGRFVVELEMKKYIQM
jgi:hypothetical protein